MLDRYQLAPEKADIGAGLRVLRGLLLLIKLTGLSCSPLILARSGTSPPEF